MIIQLENFDVVWDTDLLFDEQTDDCKNYLRQFMSTHPNIIYEWDETNRPNRAVYKSDLWQAIKTSIWNTPAPSCGISEEIITVEGTEIWHEENMSIQIKMSFKNNINMLQQYPEIGMYRKQNNIGTYIVNDFTYSYCNYLLDEHRALLIAFGGIINEKGI